MSEPIRLLDPTVSQFNTRDVIYRDGIELEKGVVLTQSFLEKNEQLLTDYWQLFTAYPDIYLDLISTETTVIHLFPFQRIMLRSCMRYNTIYMTAARATSKSFISVLAKFLQCMFIPGHRGIIVAPSIQQAVKISAQKLSEIFANWPLLERETTKVNKGKDYVDVYFKNGSTFSVVGALDSSRGQRTHSVFLDEVRDLDGDMISEVILPQLNVSRRLPSGLVNDKEAINQQVIFGTSAGMKSSYAYSALIDTLEKAIIDPKRNMSIGLDYRVPALHGLIDPKYVRDLKLSPSYNETTFASEYMSTWLGGSDESWFNFEKLSKYRTLKNPDWSQKYKDDKNVFYLISVDVARTTGGDNSIAAIFRVHIKDNRYYARMVNLVVLGRTAETKTFLRQAIDIKHLIAQYNPLEVVIDLNGLGVGLGDVLIQEQIDEHGKTLPAYGFKNNDDYKKVQPKDAICILYGIKANGPLNSQIHSNAYARLNSGLVRFLISEQEARATLLASATGSHMSFQKRVIRLMPHEMTTKLFDEMANLRLKRTGLDISLEQINSHYPKDRYSAFAYGLWRIKELEEEGFKRLKHRSAGQRRLVFFTGGT